MKYYRYKPKVQKISDYIRGAKRCWRCETPMTKENRSCEHLELCELCGHLLNKNLQE
jgi:hypothetical protein